MSDCKTGSLAAMKNYRLARAIDEAGFSILGFANWAGIPRSTVNRYINCETKPLVDNALRIARALDTTVEELWGGDE